MSLNHHDWMKILGGLGIAGTAVFAPEILAAMGAGGGTALGGAGSAALAGGETTGTLAGLSGGAGLAVGSAGAGGFSSLLTPSLVSQGLGVAASGAMGTPESKSITPTGAPPMLGQNDPFDIIRQIKTMKGGGF